jgi:hypothetical protein
MCADLDLCSPWHVQHHACSSILFFCRVAWTPVPHRISPPRPSTGSSWQLLPSTAERHVPQCLTAWHTPCRPLGAAASCFLLLQRGSYPTAPLHGTHHETKGPSRDSTDMTRHIWHFPKPLGSSNQSTRCVAHVCRLDVMFALACLLPALPSPGVDKLMTGYQIRTTGLLLPSMRWPVVSL